MKTASDTVYVCAATYRLDIFLACCSGSWVFERSGAAGNNADVDGYGPGLGRLHSQVPQSNSEGARDVWVTAYIVQRRSKECDLHHFGSCEDRNAPKRNSGCRSGWRMSVLVLAPSHVVWQTYVKR